MSTYTPIASQTLGSAAASVTFSSIPQGYTDLVLVAQAKSTTSGSAYNNYRIQFNGDTTSLYSDTFLSGNGTSATSTRDSNQTVIYAGILPQTSASAEVSIFHFMNYSNTTTNKTVLSRGNMGGTGGEVNATVGLWRSTAAITRIDLFMSGANIASGATFSLYGIQVGSAAQKAQGGNIVTSDGTYVYHTFTSSGSFTPSTGLTVDYLVVAGGAGGGGNGGGGGGAGGLRCTVGATGGGGSLESALSLSSGKSYPVIIGAGGIGGNYAATSGSDSVFATITSTGGGYGGDGNARNGALGGSGGGGGRITTTGGSGTTNQGYAGGTGFNNASGAGGGGGGAGSVGSNASGANVAGAAGGSGITTSISGTSTSYAGGGGGGGGGTSSGGSASAGGGAGGGGTGTAGTANTGGGGGGSNNSTAPYTGGNGGSGIVIIRYAL